ncbi:MAG: alkaline phosphatase family protein [Prevotella sp.]|nr:alkaline phosphatase family protein [Prevotella sp.]
MRNRYLYITLMVVLGITPEMLSAQEKAQHPPRLVVNITIDQLRTDYVEAFAPLYTDEGFKRLLGQGCIYENAGYPMARIDRASAIATLFTGVTPFYHSIVAEQWLNRETLRPAYCVGSNVENTPQNIITSTLTDELKVATDGKANIYAVAPTRDVAILSAGHAANGAFWIDDQTGLWNTSPYYMSELPAWVLGINEIDAPEKTISRLTWEPVADFSEALNFYHSNAKQKPFKHKFKGDQRIAELKTSGLVNQYVTDMAVRCLSDGGMGMDAVTDMLNVTYYAGTFNHTAMTECQWELQDTYIRLDRELARLINTVQSRVGKDHVLFVITSTGYGDPEIADYAKYRIPTGTFYINRTANLLNMYFGAIWGQGRWVEACFNNQLFLNHKLLESKRVSITDATTRAQEFLSQIAGVHNSYTSLQLISGNNQELIKVRNSFTPERSGDILIEVAPGWKLLNEDTQETELSRASFTQFPIIFFGNGMKAERIPTYVTVERIAPTIAKSIRIRAPNACSADPLF